MDEMIQGVAGVENARLSCPVCMGRCFRLQGGDLRGDMRWRCSGCGKEGRQDEMVSAWPGGTLRVVDVDKEDKPK